MKDKLNIIIYVGKAKNLKKRLINYFDKSAKTNKTKSLIKNIQNIETIVTTSESEALLLELNLIQKYKPKFNIKLKNTPTYYPYIAINLNKDFPFFEVKFHNKDSRYTYFGPFPNKSMVYNFTTKINEFFYFRTCSDNEFKQRTRPCIKHQIGVCSAPCVNLVSKTIYQKSIDQALNILKGHVPEDFITSLKEKMESLSEKELFEEASKVRDQLKLIEEIKNSQSVMHQTSKDQYFINIIRDSNFYYIGILIFENGKMTNFESFAFEDYDHTEDDSVYLEKFIIDYFIDKPLTNLVCNANLNPILAKEINISINKPKSVQEENTLNLIIKNIQRDDLRNISDDYLEKIKEELKLEKTPFKIECFDISHIQGTSVVGSKVSFINDAMDKKNYRQFRLSKQQNNDYENLYEVISKRFSDSKDPFPELLVIDGGLGQLNAAKKALEDLNIQGIEVVGIAKSRVEGSFMDNEVTESGERIIKPSGEVILLDKKNISYKIITKIRNEAHKTAITFHRKLKSKNFFS